jgi:hypothetical protein
MVDTGLLNNFVARGVLGAGAFVRRILYIAKSHNKILLKLVDFFTTLPSYGVPCRKYLKQK